jgi:hypothetical protein
MGQPSRQFSIVFDRLFIGSFHSNEVKTSLFELIINVYHELNSNHVALSWSPKVLILFYGFSSIAGNVSEKSREHDPVLPVSSSGEASNEQGKERTTSYNPC